MPRPVPVLTMEEKAARYDEMTARRRATGKAWVEKKAELHHSYYENNKEKLNARTCAVSKEKRATAKAARAALTLVEAQTPSEL